MTLRSFQFHVQALVTPVAGEIVDRSVTDELSLTDLAGLSYLREVSDDLILTDLASGVVGKFTENTIPFFDDAVFIFVPGGVITILDDLGLTDEVSLADVREVADPLNVTDVATFVFGTIRVPARSDLLLSDSVEYGYLIRNFHPVDTLGLTQLMGLARDFAVTQALGVTDEARFTGTSNVLGLTDVALFGKGKVASNQLIMTQSVDVIQGLNKGIAHELSLVQSVAYYSEAPCYRYAFKTFHGVGGVEPQEKALNYTSKLLMQSIDTGQLVELKNPETDDKRRLAFNRVNRRFFDGTADVFTDDAWVTEQTQVYTITGVKRETLDTLFQFLLDNLGREIVLKDWKGVTWIVMITNPGEVYTEDGEGYWTLDFEVEGAAIEGEYVIDPVSLVQDPSRAGSLWVRSGDSTAAFTDRANRHFDLIPESTLELVDSSAFVLV